MTIENRSKGRIVVGVDGSPASRDALRWAQEEAQVRGGAVTAVIAWSHAPLAVGAGLPPRVPDVQPDSTARAALDLVVDEVFGEDASVERLVESGSPARVLIDLSDDADLVVVGGRGRSGLAGFALGSVSQQVAQHSHCPVVVLPAGAYSNT